MRSEDYWARRMEAQNEAQLDKGEAYIRKERAEYDKAMARIKRDTEAWYSRLARNNAVSMAEARKLLTASELKEFRWSLDEYREAIIKHGGDPKWKRAIENARARIHISKLDEQKLRMRHEIEMLAAKRVKGTTDTMSDIYKDGYYRGIYEVQRGKGKGVPPTQLDKRQIDRVLSKPWAPDGSNFSARIWGDRTKLVAELETSLEQHIIRGEQLPTVIKDFSEKMGVSMRTAERLIRTEAAYFSGQSRLDGYRESGVDRYKYVATMDHRTSEKCQGMNGKVISVSEAKAGTNYPPLHAYCRSTTIPFFGEEDSEEEDEIRDPKEPEDAQAKPDDEQPKRGQDPEPDEPDAYDVPPDETFDDWAEKHAPEATEKPESPEPPAPVTPAPVKAPEPTPQSVDELMKEAAEEVDEVYAKYKEAEPQVTSTVAEIVREHGGEMAGLDFRLKTKDSFIRKVAADLEDDLKINPNLRPADVANSINDVIRYSAVTEPGSLYGLYAGTIMGLVNEGHAVRKVKNTWNDADNPYNGVNVILVSSTGVSYELQFHTPESFRMKQETLHELYEEYRLPTTPKERKMKLWKEMLRLADGMRKPGNIDRIK